jgi:ABC-type branched-subunit amino acid transport system substrate-binding protein
VFRRVARRQGVARSLSAATVVALALSLAACGSQLDPETVSKANGGATTGAQGGVAGTDAGTGDGTTDGSVAGADPGTSGTTGSTGSGSTGSTGSGSTGSGSTGSGSSGGSGGGNQGSGDNAAGGGGKGASCDGFKNQTGITDSTITIGNASDISGPVPGLFESSQDAAKAYVAYFNSTSDICGRKLKLNLYDSRTDAAADQQAYAKGCDEVFAMVGSMSGFDSGGAATAQGCGLPDIRSAAVTNERNACTTCFGAQSAQTGEFENSVPDFVKQYYPDSAAHAAMLYINAGAAAQNGPQQAKAMEARGLHFDVVQGIDIAEFNYAPYVQQLKDKGVEVVFWVGAYQQSVRLRQAMQQQAYTPKLYLRDPTDYNPDYVESGGDAVDGTVIFLNFVPFEEASSNKEVQLYLSWLQQVKPGATPTFFGLFSWSAARLFVQQSIALGGKLDRPSLVSALKGVDNWTANGMHAPQHVGSKHISECWRYVKLSGGKWAPVGGTKYSCTGVTKV